MKDIIKEYIEKCNEKNHRYLSWEHCYVAFTKSENSIDYLALHLAFYLASWGMYRGSTDLLQKDYKVHIGIVKYIKPIVLKRNYITEVNEIQKIMNDIASIYGDNDVKASKTLQTKILLGTLGCFPALDRFFIDGWKLENSEASPTVETVIAFAKSHVNEIEESQKIINRNISYPSMKVVDMYFWQLGYNKYQEKKLVKVVQ